MGIMEIIGIAGSVSLLAGWRLYLCIFATGMAMRFDVLPLPEHLATLDVLANPWVLGIAAFAALAEFFADKVMWLDSIWDAAHSLIRPVGGALLALAIVDPSDPAVQVIAFLLGGGASFAAHAGKASARGVVNASPEPVSNAVVSTAEDVATGGLLALTILNPIAALVVALILVGVTLYLVFLARRAFGRVVTSMRGDPPPAKPE